MNFQQAQAQAAMIKDAVIANGYIVDDHKSMNNHRPANGHAVVIYKSHEGNHEVLMGIEGIIHSMNGMYIDDEGVAHVSVMSSNTMHHKVSLSDYADVFNSEDRYFKDQVLEVIPFC